MSARLTGAGEPAPGSPLGSATDMQLGVAMVDVTSNDVGQRRRILNVLRRKERGAEHAGRKDGASPVDCHPAVGRWPGPVRR